jgi:hypothetical protein
VGHEGIPCRVVVATHPAGNKKSRVGVTRSGVVCELYFPNVPQQAFIASDVVGRYLHCGAFEPALADEDREQDPDRWCSHSAWGQECWQLVSHWVWNLRLELGHQLHPDPVRTTEFAPAIPPPPLHTAPPSGYAPLAWACPGKLPTSRAKTLPSSQMGRCVAPPTRSFPRMSSGEKLTGACTSCMEPASAVVVPVRCATSVNGMGVLRRSRASERAPATINCRFSSAGLARLELSGLPESVHPVDAPATHPGRR